MAKKSPFRLLSREVGQFSIWSIVTCAIPSALVFKVENIKGKARETYETASGRLGRATDALRGREDSQVLSNVGALLIGVGIGAGVGLLIALASGEKTRADIAKKVSDFGKKLPNRRRKAQGATGTYGE